MRLKVSTLRLAVVAVVAGAAFASQAGASVLLKWRLGARLDRGPLTALACPTRSLCVADSAGRLFVSTKPESRAPHWTFVANFSTTALSCPTARLCVAIGSNGDVISSTRPAHRRSWLVAHVDSSPDYGNTGGPVLTSISCPSRSLCVAVDYDGNAITSTNPAEGAAAWTLHQIDNGNDYECYHYGATGPACIPGLVAVSCASTTRCVAIDWAGGILSSNNLTGTETWGGGNQPASESYDALSCPSTGVCLLSALYVGQISALDNGADTATSSVNLEPSGDISGIWCRSIHLCLAAGLQNTSAPASKTDLFESINPTAATPVWKRAHTGYPSISAVSCPSAQLCFAAEGNGSVLVATPPVRHRR
jgi:hypothetical protein